MKRIIFILLLPLLPYCVVAQGTLVDTVRVLTLQQIPYGSLVDSVSTLYIQNGSWKRQTLDSLAKYIATKNGGGGGGATLATAAGGTGGAGTRGGGGGGGGASYNGYNSGAGGKGGDGYIRIIFY